MSAATTADRIVKDGIVATDFKIGRGVDELRENLRTRQVPVVVADNVAAYVHAHHASGHTYRVGEWPCLAPPWSWVFIEYPSATGNQRRGAYVVSFDLWKASPEELAELNGLVGAAVEDARRQSPGESVRWALVMGVFVDNGRKVIGPMGSIIWALDSFGKELGNRWFLRRQDQWQSTEDDEAMWLHAAALPALQTIAFMHCKNVVVERQERPEKLARAYRRRHGQEPVRWQTVRLELPRNRYNAAEPTRPGAAPSLHIVTGHFSHYGDCCPTQHEPKGKLFGRLEGVYWMPQHLRGDPTREVRSDRVAVVEAVSP